ncbi:MAG: MotA/TolQ/ExbB proton channel family protein [Neisseriaceae bacterium]|nr:MotA/TolQ/ExbB proton channel family protein [Neisseriaceae bacterium]
MWQIIEEAGWPIWLNITASVIGLAIILDRFYVLRHQAMVSGQRIKIWEKALQADLFRLPENHQSTMIDRIFTAAMQSKEHKKEALQFAMENQARQERLKTDRFLTTLGTIAAMAPLMGLLGTVVGMIDIFASQSPTESDPAQLAHGISVALYNTAFGLIVAIPAMVFYRYFRDRVGRIFTDAEIAASRLLPLMIGKLS